jgi:hypothetical protein
LIRSFINIVFILVVSTGLIHASTIEKVEKTGIVTYKSSQNVYVKFENTAGISKGDTLFQKINNKFVPAMIVKFISTKSIAGETLNNIDLQVDDKLIAVIEKEIPDETDEQDNTPVLKIPLQPEGEEKSDLPKTGFQPNQRRSSLKGRFSIMSYSNLSNSDYFPDN